LHNGIKQTSIFRNSQLTTLKSTTALIHYSTAQLSNTNTPISPSRCTEELEQTAAIDSTKINSNIKHNPQITHQNFT